MPVCKSIEEEEDVANECQKSGEHGAQHHARLHPQDLLDRRLLTSDAALGSSQTLNLEPFFPSPIYPYPTTVVVVVSSVLTSTFPSLSA